MNQPDGRLRWLLSTILLVPSLALAEAPPPAEAVAADAAPAAQAPPQPSATPAKPPPASLDAFAGVGYYEAVHAGLTWRSGGNHAVSAFLGTNFSLPKTNVNTAGLDWRYRLGLRPGGLDSALLVRGLYWTSEDAFYRWKLVSAQLGGSFSKEVAPGTTVTLDVAGVGTFTLESDRLQDSTFGAPTKWNVNACLSISHRLTSW